MTAKKSCILVTGVLLCTDSVTQHANVQDELSKVNAKIKTGSEIIDKSSRDMDKLKVRGLTPKHCHCSTQPWNLLGASAMISQGTSQCVSCQHFQPRCAMGQRPTGASCCPSIMEVGSGVPVLTVDHVCEPGIDAGSSGG